MHHCRQLGRRRQPFTFITGLVWPQVSIPWFHMFLCLRFQKGKELSCTVPCNTTTKWRQSFICQFLWILFEPFAAATSPKMCKWFNPWQSSPWNSLQAAQQMQISHSKLKGGCQLQPVSTMKWHNTDVIETNQIAWVLDLVLCGFWPGLVVNFTRIRFVSWWKWSLSFLPTQWVVRSTICLFVPDVFSMKKGKVFCLFGKQCFWHHEQLNDKMKISSWDHLFQGFVKTLHCMKNKHVRQPTLFEKKHTKGITMLLSSRMHAFLKNLLDGGKRGWIKKHLFWNVQQLCFECWRSLKVPTWNMSKSTKTLKTQMDGDDSNQWIKEHFSDKLILNAHNLNANLLLNDSLQLRSSLFGKWKELAEQWHAKTVVMQQITSNTGNMNWRMFIQSSPRSHWSTCAVNDQFCSVEKQPAWCSLTDWWVLCACQIVCQSFVLADARTVELMATKQPSSRPGLGCSERSACTVVFAWLITVLLSQYRAFVVRSKRKGSKLPIQH